MCGFTAFTPDLLVFFPKKYDGTVNDFCDICVVKRRYPLVKCKVCGEVAYSKEDLHHFVRRTGTIYGRGHLCWECLKKKNERIYNKRRDRLIKILAEMAYDEYLLNCLKKSGFIKH